MTGWPRPVAPPNTDLQCHALPPGFPAAEFRLEVDPPTIRTSVEPYRAFAVHCGSVAERFGRAAVSWAGDEGALYDDRRNAYAASLRTAHRSYGEFHRHITDFANGADTLQGRMTATRHEAEVVWRRLHAPQPTLTDVTRAPFAVPLLSPGMGDPRVAEAEWQRLRAQARRIRADLAVLAADVAARIGALPALTVPATAEAHAAMPPLVVRRGTISLEVTEALTHALSRQGIHVELEQLENGRIRARVMVEGQIGATAGVGGSAGGGKAEVAAEADAEGTVGLRTGIVHEMDEKDVAEFLTRLGITGDPSVAPTGSAARTGALVEGSVDVAASAEVAAFGAMNGTAEAAATASVRGEIFDDGSWTTTVTGSRSAMGEAGVVTVDDMDDDTKAWVERIGIEKVGDLPEQAGLGPVAAGIALSTAYAVHRAADGSATVTRTVRVEKEGEDEVHEKVTTRVVSADEVDGIERDLTEGRTREAVDTVIEVAGDVRAGSTAATETRELTYAVEEDEWEPELGGGAGMKAEAGASLRQRTEMLTEVDGVRRG